MKPNAMATATRMRPRIATRVISHPDVDDLADDPGSRRHHQRREHEQRVSGAAVEERIEVALADYWEGERQANGQRSQDPPRQPALRCERPDKASELSS